jgi:hypothetical protein
MIDEELLFPVNWNNEMAGVNKCELGFLKKGGD